MRLFRQSKILMRLIIVYVILCLVPILILSLYFRQFYYQLAIDQVGKTTVNTMNLLDDFVRVGLDNFKYVGDSIARNTTIQDILSNQDSLLTDQESEMLRKEVGRLTANSNLVTGIHLFDLEGKERFYVGYNSFLSSRINDYIVETKKIAPLEYYVGEVSDTGTDQLLVWREIRSAESNNTPVGYLTLVINEDAFATQYGTGIDEGENGIFFLGREDGMLLSSRTEEYKVGSYFDQATIAEIRENSQKGIPYFLTNYQGKRYLITYHYNSASGWYEILMTSEFEINREFETLCQNVIKIVMIWIAVFIMALFIIERSIIAPIRKLAHYAKDIESGKEVYIADDSKDEIGYLTRTVTSTITKVQELQKRDLYNNRRRREQELNLLQAQIKPHFLFNILNTFRFMASLNGVPALEKGLDALAKFLRTSIMTTKETITITEEIDNLYNYVYIQSLLHGNKINMHVKMEENVENLTIPKLLLQPIVENSVIHGIRNHGETLNLFISICRTEQKYQICLSDDGIGFQMGKMEKQLHQKTATHIGIDNVKERIKLHYGDKGKFFMESEYNRGTYTTITIPIKENE